MICLTFEWSEQFVHLLKIFCPHFRTDFLNRVKKNELEKKAAKAAGKAAPECRRHPKEPLGAHVVSGANNEPQFLAPIPYEFVA